MTCRIRIPVALRRALAVVALAVAMVGANLGFAPEAATADVVVDGAGSTWSQIAVDQWRADVAHQGLTINYQGVGSSSGRVLYYQAQVDFAVSEIPFQSGRETGGTDEIEQAKNRPYAYMPIVAGGTAFMYQVVANGKRITDLRLSPRTLAKIFTGTIQNWNDAEIAADNRGRKLPSLPIKVVIRSDGSGTSAQFTAFMADQTPELWNAFCVKARLGSSCPPTSFYPNPPGAGFAAQQFSDGVANFVAAPYNNGAITYVEYGYAKERGFPVASVLNKAGFYIQPTAQAVSIALQGVKLNADGTQQLRGVYTFPDPRSYPVSSYSYMIVPTSEVRPFNRTKGEALGKFILYFLCAGQQKAEQLGYSPLPKNLVQIGFDVTRRIPGAPAPPPIEQCNNPTITGKFISGAAPPPSDDQKAGAGPSALDPRPGAGSDSGSGSDSGARRGSRSGSGSGSVSTRQAASSQSALGSGAGAADSATGEVLAAAISVDMPKRASTLPIGIWLFAAAVAVIGVFGPPALAIALRRREIRKGVR
jgi:phosphate ABC transporter phosphate-binding protein